MNINLNDAQQAFGFLVSQTAHIEQEVYKTQYPDYDYASLVPVDSSANEWAKVVTFFSMDMVGAAQWQSGSAFDIPFADVERAKFDHSIHMAAIGYQYNLEEINTARLAGMGLTSDKADAARMSYAQFMYNLVFTGNSEKNMDGVLDYSGVTATNAAADGNSNGGSSSTYWAHKTPAQIIAEFNGVLSAVYEGTETVEMADTVLLPVGVMTYLGSTPLNSTSDTTLLTFIRANNVYTQVTGQPLTIRAQRGLATVAAGSKGRMAAYKRDPKVLKLHLPMPHRFLPIWQNGPMNFVIPGIFRTGGVEIRRPKAVRYLDLISATPT
ncbi:major capsid family protein [Nitratireductor sp. StC3]|uniref:DUF2184 domain-containing protein n=1 Tax=Nitratireductor sp. StC3 TaxID=2126741 RepID=UPI000D0CEA7F|nr:major capsid family protein [Nitratireductor sp. StC3]PSM18228.1 hypothetical protein C7T96_10175 [Nitratireductor sp. StC3]